MGIVVLEFIRDTVLDIIEFMKDFVIFDAYPPIFQSELTLWDIFLGALTVTLVMNIFGFPYDDDDDVYEDEETQIF